MNMDNFVIGLDFGTDSCRAIIVNTADGEILSESVVNYPRWIKGEFCNADINQFRQHPSDYLESMENAILRALQEIPSRTHSYIRGISAATTGSTIVPVNKEGIPLSLTENFYNNPDAMFILWKDHTAVKEAEEINTLAHSWGGIDYTKYEGGVYSAEWFWAKILHIIRTNEEISKAAYSWLEHCDWIPAVLTGNRNLHKIKRSRCAAGHKAMWHPSFSGLPSVDFLERLDKRLPILRERLYTETYTADIPAGTLSPKWAAKLGLSENVVVGTGAFDAHMGAVGGGISPGTLVKVMGTSSCDMIVVSKDILRDRLVKGICGQVEGSIIPNMIGLEAGQSAFGDIYAWFKKMLAWPLSLMHKISIIDKEKSKKIKNEIDAIIIDQLSREALRIKPGSSSVLALDWLNGRRSPYANQFLRGAIAGLTLGSDAPRIFRALVEATAFGTRSIIERFEEEGIHIKDVIGIGGVSKKSPFVVQVVSDVINRRIRVARTEQTVALGAAEFAAVASGSFKTIEDAQKAMGSGFDAEYVPNPSNTKIYDRLYTKYKLLGNLIEKYTKTEV